MKSQIKTWQPVKVGGGRRAAQQEQINLKKKKCQLFHDEMSKSVMDDNPFGGLEK